MFLVEKLDADWPRGKQGASVHSHLHSAKPPVEYKLFYSHFEHGFQWLLVVWNEMFLRSLVESQPSSLSVCLSVCLSLSLAQVACLYLMGQAVKEEGTAWKGRYTPIYRSTQRNIPKWRLLVCNFFTSKTGTSHSVVGQFGGFQFFPL